MPASSSGVVPTELVVKRLRELGFSYQREGDRGRLYRKAGSVQRVVVKKSATLAKETARIILRQAGDSEAAIDGLLGG